MTTGKLLGIVLMFAAGADILVAKFVAGPKIKDPEQAKLIVTVLVSGAALLGLVGLGFFVGFIPLP